MRAGTVKAAKQVHAYRNYGSKSEIKKGFPSFFYKSADDESDMFSGSMMEMLLQIITSWQVIVITVAIVVYMFLVNYVARTYRRPRFVSKTRPKKAKNSTKAGPKVAPDKPDDNEALGLEES